MASNQRQSSKAKRAPAAPPEFIDPRHGDVEDDASSTKRRSMLSLFGSMLVEISLPKLIIAWILLLVVPGLLLGLAPIVFAEWLTVVADKLASLVLGLWSLLILACLLVVAWFGWRALFRMAEKNFWALNSIVVEPSYASFREAFRQLAERLLCAQGERRTPRQAPRRRRRSCRDSGLLACPAGAVARLAAYSSVRRFLRDRVPGRRLPWWRSPTASPLSRAISPSPRLIWGFADALMAPPRTLHKFADAAEGRPHLARGSSTPTSMWSESATASASKAAGRARAAMTACGACSSNSRRSTPSSRSTPS